MYQSQLILVESQIKHEAYGLILNRSYTTHHQLSQKVIIFLVYGSMITDVWFLFYIRH